MIARPYPPQGAFDVSGYGSHTVLGAVEGNTPFRQIAQLKPSFALELRRQAMSTYPEADTIMFPSPHWPVVDAIEPLEHEFGVSVMSSLQAIVWRALRLTGIGDRTRDSAGCCGRFRRGPVADVRSAVAFGRKADPLVTITKRR